MDAARRKAWMDMVEGDANTRPEDSDTGSLIGGARAGSKESDDLFKVAAVASALVMGAYLYRGLKTPLPGQDQDIFEGLEVEKHEFQTPDGSLLVLKRYVNREGTPVLFCHGFNGNGFEFDIPIKDRNIAVYLARNGYDVWISSFRGCGRRPYKCDAGDWKHSVDHLAIYDAPTMVDGIIEATGRKPFWIGHSMGGLVLYMYLQGVRFAGDHRVVSDPDLVKERNDKLLGGIPIASPPSFWWPRFHPFRTLTDSGLGRIVLGAVIHLLRLRGMAFHHYPIGSLALRVTGNRPRLIKALSRSPVGMMLYNRKNTDSETSTALVRWGADDVSTRMLVQLLDCIRNTHLRQYYPLSLKDEPYDYTMNMHLLNAPMFFIAGDKDPANWEAIERFGHDRVSSATRKMVVLPGYGHTDLVMGKNVDNDVYPLILQWIREVEANGSGA